MYAIQSPQRGLARIDFWRVLGEGIQIVESMLDRIQRQNMFRTQCLECYVLWALYFEKSITSRHQNFDTSLRAPAWNLSHIFTFRMSACPHACRKSLSLWLRCMSTCMSKIAEPVNDHTFRQWQTCMDENITCASGTVAGLRGNSFRYYITRASPDRLKV